MAPRPPDVFDRGWSAFVRVLEAPITGPGRADVAGVAFLAVLAVLLLTAPVLFVQDMPLDLFVQFDGAWRWMAGQRPHVDFYTPVGDLWYLLLGLAGTLSGGDPRLVFYSSLLLVPFVATGAWVATDRRLPPVPRVLLAVAITCCALSPRTLDSSLISAIATYNRYGWAFVGIVAAAVLLEPVGGRRIGPAVAVVSLAIIATFWTKVTYLGLIAAALVLSALFVPANRRLAVASGVLGGVGVLLGAVTAQGRAYLADSSRAAESTAGGPGLLRMDKFVPEVKTNLPELVAVMALAIIVMRTSRDADQERIGSRAVAAAVAFTGAAVVVTSQSHDRWIPVSVVAIAVLFAALRARGPGLAPRLAGTVLCGLLTHGLVMDAAAITILSVRPRLGPTGALAGCPPGSDRCLGEAIRVPAGSVEDAKIVLVQRGEIPGKCYDNLVSVPWNIDDRLILNDGMALLHDAGLERAKIASLTFSQSFPWLLGSPSPRHLPNWWDWHRTLGPADIPRLSAMLADSDVVLVPEVWRVEGVDLARPTLEAEFEVRARSELWTLWTRQSQPGPASQEKSVPSPE